MELEYISTKYSEEEFEEIIKKYIYYLLTHPKLVPYTPPISSNFSFSSSNLTSITNHTRGINNTLDFLQGDTSSFSNSSSSFENIAVETNDGDGTVNSVGGQYESRRRLQLSTTEIENAFQETDDSIPFNTTIEISIATEVFYTYSELHLFFLKVLTYACPNVTFLVYVDLSVPVLINLSCAGTVKRQDHKRTLKKILVSFFFAFHFFTKT